MVKVVLNHKEFNISHNFFCIELKLSTVVAALKSNDQLHSFNNYYVSVYT